MKFVLYLIFLFDDYVNILFDSKFMYVIFVFYLNKSIFKSNRTFLFV